MNIKADQIADAERAAEAAYQTIPDTVTIAEALILPWGGMRNLTLRKALGIPLGNGDMAMVNQGGVIQVVTPTRAAARRHAAKLVAALPDEWEVQLTRRPDRQWLVNAHA